MREIRIGLIGTGYMGKAHAVALKSVASVFDTGLRPICETICATTLEGAREKARAFGFNRATDDWRTVVADPAIDAVVIASPQSTHMDIAIAAFENGKAVFCEKPLASHAEDCRRMMAAAEASGLPNMTGFNYIRTPASQFAHDLVQSGRIGQIHYIRAEHTEDFLSDPQTPSHWRTKDISNGCMGDLAPHIINAALRLAGPISSVSADIQTVHSERPGANGPEAVTNDDQAHLMCRFQNGAMGHLFISRVATGRKMGYAYEIYGDKGSIRFDQEDQNALWLYLAEGPEAERGFRKILTGPAHPDYLPFCQGPGHGTGYQDQIIIEMRDFLKAIETGAPVWPTFRDGLEVQLVTEAAWKSSKTGTWATV
ncbi:Gfo/Idh/MocA family oxidoreductase [uncultured Roseibium sp.]|uniref:Gfo/Idh/MocA family protein n=1 Tax=uncultured Roseibium sp. TaxID=1936171 RepID=UPI00262142D9|nr:Gfo/Idh/MocA family oxidoreductase [uncultured Roseibium sp.]